MVPSIIGMSVLLLFKFDSILCTAMSNTVFLRVSDSSFGASRIGLSFGATDLLSCLMSCHLSYPPCHSVQYDTLTLSCTPGSPITYGNTELTDSVTHMLYVNGCNTSLGFQLYTDTRMKECLIFSDTLTDFYSARSACAAKDARLVMPKSYERYQSFLRIASKTFKDTTWVGMTDLQQEGQFVWEDGTIFTPTGITSIPRWTGGQPDNYNSNEDCVQTGPNVGFAGINDGPCYDTGYYICQLV